MLGVTTSHAESSTALMRDGDILDERAFGGARACVEELIPVIEDMLRAGGLDYSDVDLFAVDVGPGGLTGIKIGVVAVRTLAQVSGKPTVAVSSLQAIAAGAPAGEKLIMCATNCSAIEIYTAVFRGGGDGEPPERLAPDRLDTPESGALRLAEFAGDDGIYITGNAGERVRNHVAGEGLARKIRMAPTEYCFPRASAVCRLALTEPRISWRELQANYLCVTNAERMAARKSGG